MKVIVIGASGTIGKAVATALSDAGHEVIRVSRHTQPSLNLDDPASIDGFFKTLGVVDAIVCAAGNAAFGSITQLSDEQIQLCLNSKLLGQVNLVRKGLSHLRPGGVFVLTGGIMAFNPWPQASAVALVNAGLDGFVRGAALDLKDQCRILIVHPPLVRESAVQMGMDGTPFPVAATVAKAYLGALENENTGQAVFLDGYHPS
jgi:NAD(P)-dependent dehydrogenase (short-subunit alcohol dehydrogenase family)